MVDYFGVSMVVYVLAIAELLTLGWIYGVSQICKDAEFMLGIQTSWYWRICWGIITPLMMISILIYQIVQYEPLKYNGYEYPTTYHGMSNLLICSFICSINIISISLVIGWCLSAIGICQLPLWAGIAVYRQEGKTMMEKIRGAIKPTADWGPLDPDINRKYRQFMSDNHNKLFRKTGLWHRMVDNVFK